MSGEDDFDDLSGEQLELTDLLNTALDKGVVLHGDVTLAVADIDLVKLDLALLLSALETIEQARPSGALLGGERQHGRRPTVDRPTLAGTLGPPAFGPRQGDVQEQNGEEGEGSRAGASPQPDTPLNAVAHGLPDRINADASRVESGLARLVLTLIEVLRKVLEHQAVRRMDGGKLSPVEIERLGLALSKLNDRMDELKHVFGLSDEDLEIDLGPLGRLR